MDAHKVFDAMSTHHEVTMSSVIHVSVSHIVYPVTEAVIRKVFELYGCGVVRMVVFQGNSSVEASVQMSSGHEAVRARDALHGRNIYDGCCNISIECTPMPSSHNASTLPTAPFLSMVPNVTLVTFPTTAAPMSSTATEDTPVAAGYMSSMETASVGTQKVFAQMSTSSRGSSSAKVVAPTEAPTPATCEEQSTLTTLDTDTPQCQDKRQQHHVAEVFDTRLEEAESWTKPSRIIKWVSRVPIPRRRVRWTLQSKFRNSTTVSPPPPAPPHPPDQRVHSLDPCPPSLPPAPPRPPDHLSDTSKDYLCTVRCGIAAQETQPPGEECVSQGSSNAATGEKHEQEAKSITSSSDEDSWVEVKIPESPLGNYTPESQEERNAIGTCQENTLAHYEATAEITEANPCVSLTVCLLSLQSKTPVHIEEIYILADLVESNSDDSVAGPGNMGGSSLLAMLVPGLMQISKSRDWKILDDKYFPEVLKAQLPEGCTLKDSIPCGNIAKEAGLHSTNDSKFRSAGLQSRLPRVQSGMICDDSGNQHEFPLNDPKPLPLPVKTTENIGVILAKNKTVSNPHRGASPVMNEIVTPHNRIERMLDTLISKVGKVELGCSRFQDKMMRPLDSIEARLQRLEQQFNSFSVEIQSLRGSSARMSALNVLYDGNSGTPASVSNRRPGLVLVMRAPKFYSEDYSNCDVADENTVNLHGPNIVPRVLKASVFNMDSAVTIATKQLGGWVILHYQNLCGNLMTLLLEVKTPMQRYVYWHSGKVQLILCGTSKEKPELTCDSIPTTEISDLRLEILWDPEGWHVTLVHSLCTLQLVIKAHSVLDIMPPWRRGGFNPGACVCYGFIREMESECYFHLQYYKLFGFNTPLCGALTLAGKAWDPGGCFTLLLRDCCCLTFGMSNTVLQSIVTSNIHCLGTSNVSSGR